MTKIWMDGKVVEGTDALVPVLDHGFTVGDGVFETCGVRDGQAFALTRHLGRLRRSADILGLVCPSEDQLRRAVAQVLDESEPTSHGRLRITLTGGVGPLGSGRGEAEPTLVIALSAARQWADPIAVVTVPWTRNQDSAVAGAKTTSYAENVVALAYARRHGADEALLCNTRGELCEGTGSNVFLVLGGRLCTPPLSSGCLGGITRELMVEWAAAEGDPVVEEPLTPEDLTAAEDVLLASSTRNVQHVSVLDGREVSPSDRGRWASVLFERRAAERMDP
jgi:branched-chain amino acid aminotransferase